MITSLRLRLLLLLVKVRFVSPQKSTSQGYA